MGELSSSMCGPSHIGTELTLTSFFLLSRVERLEDQTRAGLASLEAKIQTMIEQCRHEREETKQELKQELTKLRNGLVKMGDDILTGTQVTGKVRGGVSRDDEVEEMED